MKKFRQCNATLIRIMRVTITQIMLAITFFGITRASNVDGQTLLDKKITISVESTEIGNVLNQIEKLVSVKFSFLPKQIQSGRKVSLNLSNQRLEDVLQLIFKPTKVKIEVVGNSQIILSKENSLTNNLIDSKNVEAVKESEIPANISGIVSDIESNLPLSGVSIKVKGKVTGTTTDGNGKFTISADPKDVLIFSSIGYSAIEVTVGNRTVIKVALSSDIQTLNEVVVVGYGTQSRKDVSSAIGSIKGTEIKAMAVTGADQAIQGKLAGVSVTSNDGTPGGSTKVTIRGIGSLNNTNPLYVIDGVMSRQGLTNIVANDIESIDILKDASAAAIYGLQGANGVVIVTTKRGKKGKTRLTFDAYSGISTVGREIEMVSPQQYAEWNNESANLTNAFRTANGRTDLIPLNPAWANPASITTGTNWQREIFKTGKMNDYQMGISGADDKVNYAISLGYRNQQGLIPTSEYQRFNSRFNIDYKATSFLKVGVSLSYTGSRTRGVDNNNLGGGVVQYTMLYSPLLPVYQPGYPNSYSTIPSESLDPNNKYWYAFVPNPFSVFAYTNAKTDLTNLYASTYLELKLPYGFSARSQMGLYTYDAASYSWSKSAETPWDPKGSNRGQAVNGVGIGGYKGYGYNWDNTMNYLGQFGNHTVNVTAGISAQLENNYNGSFIRQTNFVSEAVPYLGYGDPLTTVTSPTSISEVTLFGVLGRIIYGYKNKYLFTANVRRDQSSRFSEELRTAVFPSASVAWRISEENFAKSLSFISDLKLRVGWGKIGNQNGIPAYPTYNLLGSGQDYNINGVLVSGVAPTGLGNKNISWESTVSTNIGLDFTILNKSLGFTADYYMKDNSQILLQLPIVATGGVGIYPTSVPGPAQNVGRIRNSGLELTATYAKKFGEFNFSISGNGTWNRNEILNLGGSDYLLPPNIINQLGNYVSRFAVGHSIGEFYGYQTDGIFQNQREISAANEKAQALGKDYFQEKFTAPGDYKYKDVNNDGVINNDDRTFIGNPNPKFAYGITLNGSYKGFDLTAFFQGIGNVDVFNALAYRTEASYVQPFNRTKRAFEERWRGEGTSNIYPRIISDDPNNNSRISSRYIESGSYMRMRNVQLGYSLPKSLLAKLKVENMRFYVAGQNLLTFTKYRGLDPEMGVGQNEGNSDTNYDLGIDRGMYPQPRTVMIGLNLTF